jgi:hypothetical protein
MCYILYLLHYRLEKLHILSTYKMVLAAVRLMIQTFIDAINFTVNGFKFLHVLPDNGMVMPKQVRVKRLLIAYCK